MHLTLKNVGQIRNADIAFGDLTVLVGPQATGKSVFLQFLKLAVDAPAIQQQLRVHGLDWDRKRDDFLQVYLGEGMQGVWAAGHSEVRWGNRSVDMDRLAGRRFADAEARAFFIPAQRVLTLGKGWPRPFTDYSAGDPFVVRDFSEKLRLLMESGLGRGEAVFPQTRRLKEVFRDELAKNVFHGFGLAVERHGSQKRLVLQAKGAKEQLPFMVWSAGQREFVPLLLGLYWLLPPRRMTRREPVEWVVVEEPEMGLHPRAISVVLLLILDLLARGYRVCLSTHSPHVLDMVWALRTLRQYKGDPRAIPHLFGVPANSAMVGMAAEVLRKTVKVYLFDGDTGTTKDISALDPGSDDGAESGWGGLTEFSGRAAELVAGVVENGGGSH